MFVEVLQSYYASLITLIIFIFMVFSANLMDWKRRKFFLLEAFLVLTMIIITGLDGIMATIQVPELALPRKITSFLNFALSPLSPILLLLIYNDRIRDKVRRWFFLPLVTNFILCLASTEFGWIFNISDINGYTRGPLFFVPFLVGSFYIFMLVVLIHGHDSRPNRQKETMMLVLIVISVAIALVLEIVFDFRYLLWSTTQGGVILYFLMLNINSLTFDNLTGAYGRQTYSKYLEKIERRGIATVAILDLNRLKYINDTLGHSAGDLALTRMAGALACCKAKSSILFRIGGDEFVLIDKESNRFEISDFLEKALKACQKFEDIPVAFSFGVVDFMGGSIQAALDEADRKMYRHKQEMLRSNPIKPDSTQPS